MISKITSQELMTDILCYFCARFWQYSIPIQQLKSKESSIYL